MAQINTIKGKSKKQHEGFLFIFDKLIAEGEQKAWRCEAKNKGCRARIWTDLQDNLLQPKTGTPTHTHDANPANVISQRGMTAIKRRAVETMEPPAMLRTAIMENVPSPALYAMPTKASIKQIIKRARGEDQAAPPNPQTIAQLEIPDRYKQYSRNDNEPPEVYLLADSGIFNAVGDQRQHRILIFGRSSWWNNWGNQMTELYCDGTFRIAPPLFYQVYVLMARRGEWIFPIAYALLTGKTRAIYDKMLELIRGFAPQFNPQSVHLDYEEAVINAFKNSFPNIAIKGCYFHLMQNLRDKLGKHHLMQQYNLNTEFSENARMITSIAFVNPAYIVQALHTVLQIVQNTPLERILEWFMKYYTGIPRPDGTLPEARFPIGIWNLHQRTINGEHRTNNVSEAAHRRLQALLNCTHPSLWKFIELLWKEQKDRDADYSRYIAGENPPEKQEKYRKVDRQILNVFAHFNPQNMEEFLRGMARNCQMKP